MLIPRGPARIRAVILAAALVAAVPALAPGTSSALGTGSAGSHLSKPRVLVLGDSLTWQAAPYLKDVAAFGRTFAQTDVAFSGVAPCDWLAGPALHDLGFASFNSMLASLRPVVADIETVGNSLTRCMLDASGTPLLEHYPLFVAKYAADLARVTGDLEAHGVRIVFLTAPPMRNPGLEQVAIELARIGRCLQVRGTFAYPDACNRSAGKLAGFVVDTAPARAISGPFGSFTLFKPCLRSETMAQGCVGGQIQVRSADGVHLCVRVTPQDSCAGYSSGARRWASALAEATLLDAPRPG